MFFTPVCHSVHRGADTPQADNPMGRYPDAHPRVDAPRAGTHLGRHPQADTPQQTATAPDGTHPTGVHSCFNGIFVLIFQEVNLTKTTRTLP